MFERYDKPVRCSAGHLFTSVWIPMCSLKAVRLGRLRYQHCPVGHHWAVVRLLDATAPAADLAAAAAVHDIRIP